MKAWLAGGCGAVLLAGCAATRIDANVHTMGTWPAARPPGTYAFQRLPSQQAQPKEQDKVEAEARPAIERAGFRPAAPPDSADVLVQVATRSVQVVSGVAADPFYGPYWPGAAWGGAWRGGAWGGGWGGAWGWGATLPGPWTTINESAVLILDARTQAPLYESRAQTDASVSDRTAREALFFAALRDFPLPAVSPRKVSIDLPLPASAPASAAVPR